MLSQVTLRLHVRRSLNCTSAEQQWQLKCSVCAIKPVKTAAPISLPFCPCKSLNLRISLISTSLFFFFFRLISQNVLVVFSKLWNASICYFILLFDAIRDTHPSSDWYCRQRFKIKQWESSFYATMFSFSPLHFMLFSLCLAQCGCCCFKRFSKTLGCFAFMSVLNTFIIFISSTIS